MIAISVGGIFEDGGVEVSVMPIDKFAYRAGLRAANVRGLIYPLSLHGKIYNAIFIK